MVGSIDMAWDIVPSNQMGLRADLGSFGDIEWPSTSLDEVGVI